MTGFSPTQTAAPQTTGQTANVSQIPGGGYTNAPPVYKDTNTYFGGIADALNIPQETQRNISNTLNALGGWTAPVGGLNRARYAAGITKGLEPTAEMIQKAEQAAQIANTPRLLPPAKAGLEALSEEAAATRAAAENARRMRQLEQDRQAATGAQQSVEAATKSANIAQKTAEEIADAQNAARLNQAKMTGAAQGLDIMQAVDSATSPSGLPTLKNIPADTSGFDTSAFENLTLPETKEEPAPVDEMGNVTGPAKGGIDWNDMMIKMGLGMMAGKSPHALTNVGEAGLQALQLTAAEKKAASEQALHEAQAEMARQHGMLFGALPAIKAGQLSQKDRIAADVNAEKAFQTMLKANPFAYQTPESQMMLRNRLKEAEYDRVLSRSGAQPGAAPAAPTGAPKFLGFE